MASLITIITMQNDEPDTKMLSSDIQHTQYTLIVYFSFHSEMARHTDTVKNGKHYDRRYVTDDRKVRNPIAKTVAYMFIHCSAVVARL